MRASNSLAEKLNAHVGVNWQKQEILPPEGAFDQAGEAAARLGKRAIYLLFDEAQAMFARKKRGQDAAERLKARLEARWGKARPGYAPIRLGLVGQPHLFRLISGQLDAVFGGNIYRGTEIDVDEIEKLLRERTLGAMQSTREARRLLGTESRSLYVLRVLMQEVQKILRDEQRTWFIRADVEAAIQALIKDAIEIPYHTNRNYIRDALNASDNLTEWHPIAGYPVAIAWALALSEGRQKRIERLERSRTLLDTWIKEFASSSHVPESRVSESIDELKDLEVLTAQEQFTSELLQRFLSDLAREPVPLQEEEERRALQSLCVDTVQLPDVSKLHVLGKGGQADVYVGTLEERETTIRVVRLTTERERIAFVEMGAAIRAIEGTRNRGRGYQSLPVTRRIGFTDDRALTGVIMYDFVPGNSLDDRRHKLGTIALIDVGRSIAEALAVLAQRRVVHRDVKPGNIVLNPDGGVPVLVDFGFARLVETTPDTHFDESEYRAPEVRKRPAQWSPRADVFALAVSLRELAAEGAIDEELELVLAKASAPRVEERLSADGLASELGALATKAQIENLRSTQEAAFDAAIRGLQERRVKEIAGRYRGEMVATALGIFGKTQALCSSAQFLQDIFEHQYYVRFQASGPLSKPYLSSLQPYAFPNTVLVQLCDKETVATGKLRHGHAHRRDTEGKLRDARAVLGGNDEKLISAIKNTAGRLERWSRLTGLAALINLWLKSVIRA